jgi:hypothetical protein
MCIERWTDKPFARDFGLADLKIAYRWRVARISWAIAQALEMS